MATKLAAVFFATILTSCKAQEICSEFQDNCNAYSDRPGTYQCLISCNEGEDCVAVDDSSNCPDISTPAPINYGDMNGQKCEKICQDDNDHNCAFYRHDVLYNTRRCFLMNENQCDDGGDGCKAEDECASGPVNCASGGFVVPPEEFTCPSGSSHTPDTIPNFNLHWNCKDVNNNYADHDITSTTPAPGNTVCTAKPDCNKNGQKQHYVYKCVQKNGGAATEGEWKWDDVSDGTEDPGLVETADGADKGKLKEATCNADPLTISTYADQVTRGMEILCVGEEIGDDGIIPAQNSCILICDGYPILHIYTKMAEWMYTMMDDPTTENSIPVDNSQVIYCHK